METFNRVAKQPLIDRDKKVISKASVPRHAKARQRKHREREKKKKKKAYSGVEFSVGHSKNSQRSFF